MIKKVFALALIVFTMGAGMAQATTRATTINATKTQASKAHTVNLSVADNNGSKTIKKGDIVKITLEANSSTGYTWDIASNNKKVLRYDGKKYIEPKSTGSTPIVGAAGKEVLTFKAIKTGTSTLKLVYHRPWEKNVKPAKTFTVKITVKK